ncbi:MAG: hypothetical protein E7518_03455 [Ruminococcaceae bacterium]|jgi:hypothetical protein|nr:hypothetical protein [Oscillospiraceae bacterium]
MNFIESVTGNVTKAVDYLVEKNRKAAVMNRLRIVIKNERDNEARAFAALGKYYYQHLRDPENEETEHLCRAVDFSDRRMKKAFAKLDEIASPKGCEEDSAADCADDCDFCPYCGDPDSLDDVDVPAEGPMEEPSAPAKESPEDIAVPSFAFADEVPEEAADDDEPIPPEL